MFSLQLVKEYKDGNTEIKRILNHLDFYIVPTLNVDGYAHTWKNVSMSFHGNTID